MSDVGDAIELTYTTAPGATVTMDWIHLPTGVVLLEDEAVPELIVDDVATGQYPITLLGSMVGRYEARFTSSGTSTAVESYFEDFDVVGGPPPLATLGEYTDLYGSLSAARAATAKNLIKRASQLVRDRLPGLDAKIAAGTIPEGNVSMAVINMVVRVMRNPGGLRSETTGPFSRSYDMDAASGMLEISEADLELLIPVVLPGKKARGKMGTVRVTGGMVPAANSIAGDYAPYYGPVYRGQ
jgi:hypothetical protein